jgi:hypothetical protein
MGGNDFAMRVHCESDKIPLDWKYMVEKRQGEQEGLAGDCENGT